MSSQTDHSFPSHQDVRTGPVRRTEAQPTPRPRAVALARPSAPAGPVRLLVATLAALATLAATLLLGVVGAVPAQAHDRILSSDPADGAQLDAAPAALTMTFSTEPLAVEPQVVVTDTAGTVVAQGAPTIEGTSATFPWPAELTGDTYTVAWRVVSSDGHPIEGTFSFAVAAAPELVETPATEETVSATPSGSTDEGDETTATDVVTDEDTDEGRSIAPLLVGIGVLAAAAVVVAVLIVRRRRHDQV
ncbi:copper resistance protein CopC [Oerskovia sp. Sa1BUA8]|uniref:Copper resistance protein CopC n=1 Tax=Oerskovia douganii TaxID=2762210 RepID=A0A9D5YYT1_9CELL|nr:copper resistance CopC family protein [Oerskovia douganii]MBE7699836.1 copper resistance protein CopC [Oerskovia douganii]